jgi:hypothetical protein
MKRLVLSLFVLATCVFCFSQIPPALAPAYDASVQAVSASSKIDEKAWQGFRFRDCPVLIYDSASRAALAVNVPSAFQGFTATSQPSIFYGQIPQNEIIGPGIRPFGPKLMVWIDIRELTKSYTPAFVIVEEAFKIFEAYRGFNDKGTFVPGAYPVLNVENNTMSRFENSLLIKAVTSPKEEMRPYLSAFNSAREKRQALLPKEISESEESRELVDGSAAYAAYLSLSEEQQRGYVQEVLIRLGNYNKGGEGAEKRFKDTGFAQCYLFGVLQYDFRTTIEKYSKDSLKSALKAVIVNIKPADGSFFGFDAAMAEEAAATKIEEDRRTAILAQIQKAEGLVVYVKIGDFLASTNGKIPWSNRYEPQGIIHLSAEKIIYEKYFKLECKELFNFASSRPIFVEAKKSLTVGFSAGDIQLMMLTVDGNRMEFAKDSPPVTGAFEAKGPQWEMKISKATLTWDYTTRTLTIEPVYDPNPPAPAPVA